MIRPLLLGAAFVAMAGTASAGPLTFSVAGGNWNNASAPDGVCVDYDNHAAAQQDEIRWGGGFLTSDPALIGLVPSSLASYITDGDACWIVDPTYGLNFVAAVSGYNFDPFDGVYTFSGTPTPFALGTFKHLNFQIFDGITSVHYTLQVAHTGSSPGSPLDLDLLFQHNETDNFCETGPGCSDDIVTVSIPGSATIVQFGTEKFLFELLGFSTTGLPGTYNTVFTSPEDGSNETQFFAQVTPVVPEPATLVLLLTGLAGLGLAGRRRRPR